MANYHTTGATARDTTAAHCGDWIAIPAGTRVRLISGGGMGPAWAVDLVADVVAVTGDWHTAEHYHAWIDAADVITDAQPAFASATAD